MADKPIWEQIGSGFVQHYYQQFDTDRVKLADLYVSLTRGLNTASKINTDASCLTWEGEGFQGKAAIMTKLNSLPFQTIQHIITAQDHHPTPDNCVMSMVMGQLKADQDQVMGFQQVFLLKNVDNKWVCTNDMFRLALHNFGA
ncbi:Nuclear transport factor 2 [Triplophysa tibetana]|uniref:NTF2-related export protein n=1 Tax=Triplophysa tibetana TaxID=1572043 RepID=A0A5A9NPV8_9TELE|nr:Nuclear transport factor 2 [Triplophysa tibetana]